MTDRKKNQPSLFTEGNFTAIPNDLLEALINSKMNGTQLRVMLHLARNTYGWRRETAEVSLSGFAEACGSIRQWMSKQLQEMLDQKKIFRSKIQPGKTPVYKINENYSEWDDNYPVSHESFQSERGAQSKTSSCEHMTVGTQESCDSMTGPSCDYMTEGSCDSMTGGSSDSMTSDTDRALQQPDSQQQLKKEYKENIKKEKERGFFLEDSLYFSLAKLLLDKILYRMPAFTQHNLQQWTETIKEIIETDKRNPETVKRVIIFSQSDPFWQSNILEADKLREKFDYVNSKRLSRAGKRSSKKYDEYEIYMED